MGVGDSETNYRSEHQAPCNQYYRSGGSDAHICRGRKPQHCLHCTGKSHWFTLTKLMLGRLPRRDPTFVKVQCIVHKNPHNTRHLVHNAFSPAPVSARHTCAPARAGSGYTRIQIKSVQASGASRTPIWMDASTGRLPHGRKRRAAFKERVGRQLVATSGFRQDDDDANR